MPFLPTSQKSQQATDNKVPPSITNPSSNKLKDFETVFPKLVKDLEENAKQYNIPEEALKWYSDVCPSCSSPTLPNSVLLPGC